MEKYMEWTFIKDDEARTLTFECYTDLLGDGSETVLDSIELDYFDALIAWDVLYEYDDFFISFIQEECDDVVRITTIVLCDKDYETTDLGGSYTPDELLCELVW